MIAGGLTINSNVSKVNIPVKKKLMFVTTFLECFDIGTILREYPGIMGTGMYPGTYRRI